MPDRGLFATTISIGAYNLIQNLLVPPSAYVPANVVASCGLVALARSQGCSWRDLGLDLSRSDAGIRLGIAGIASVAALTATSALSPITRRFLFDRRAWAQRNRDIAYRTLVRFPLGTALFEEVAFRGVAYAVWRRSGRSPTTAALASAAAFGLWHVIPGNDALAGNPLSESVTTRRSRAGVVLVGTILTSLGGLGLTWMRERSGSLVAPWMTHAAVNCAGYLAGVAAWRLASPRGDATGQRTGVGDGSP